MYELEVIDMGKKEEQAREYAKSRYGNNGYETGNEIAKVQACTVGYIAGWDEALKSQWVNVKEQQPAANELVLCRMVSNEAIVSGYIYSEGGNGELQHFQILNLKIMEVITSAYLTTKRQHTY